MLRSAFAHIFHGARGVSRPKVHEKRDRDEGTAATPERRARDRKGDQTVVVAVAVVRKREKKEERNILL